MNNIFYEALVTSQKVGFFQLFGQSNAYGSALVSNLPSGLNNTLNAKIFNIDASPANWENINCPLNNGGWLGHNNTMVGIGSETGYVYGVEMRLMQLLTNYYNYPFFLHKYCYPGTALAATGDTNPDWSTSSSGKLYDLSNQNYVLAKTKMQASSDLQFVIWIQGENDTTNSSYYNAYQSNLQNFITAKRAFYGLNKLPFIIVGLGDTQTGIDSTGKAVVKAAQISIGGQAYNKFVSTDGLAYIDGVHRTPASVDDLAYRIFTQIQTLYI